jgi:hypothetical protein
MVVDLKVGRSKETAPAGELRPLIRTPDGGGVFQPGVPLRSTPPSADESKLPARELFQATWLHLRIRRSGIGQNF